MKSEILLDDKLLCVSFYSYEKTRMRTGVIDNNFKSALTKLVEVYAAFFKAISGTSLQKARAEMTNVQKFMVEVKEKRPQI